MEDNGFVFTYPVFFLLNPGPPVSFVCSPLLGPNGTGVYVFTDEHAADEYLAENPQPPGVIKHPAHNQATFAAKVAILEQMKQFTHLIIDARGAGIKPRRCVEIPELLAHLDRQAS